MIIFQTGDVFVGRYRLEEQIGHGGMAAVWRATQLVLNRAVALKLILPTAYDDPMYRELFATEAQLSAKLVHPNIVPVLDYGETLGILFLVQQFISGKDLAQVITASPQGLPEPIALYIITQCLYGLQCAHDENVIHRDIKPANVLVSNAGNVQLSDFGIAKSVTPGSRSVSTMIKGSPGYMAPEVLRGQASSASSDLFALGSMLWEALTGHNLFAGGTPERDQVFFNTLNRDVPKLAEVGVRVDPEVDTIIRRLLARDPANRYQRASEVLDDLLPVVTTMGAVATAQELRRYLPSTLDTIIPTSGMRPPTPPASPAPHRRTPEAQGAPRNTNRTPIMIGKATPGIVRDPTRTPSMAGQVLPPSRARSGPPLSLVLGAGTAVVLAGIAAVMLVTDHRQPSAAPHAGAPTDATPARADSPADAAPRIPPPVVSPLGAASPDAGTAGHPVSAPPPPVEAKKPIPPVVSPGPPRPPAAPPVQREKPHPHPGKPGKNPDNSDEETLPL